MIEAAEGMDLGERAHAAERVGAFDEDDARSGAGCGNGGAEPRAAATDNGDIG